MLSLEKQFHMINGTLPLLSLVISIELWMFTLIMTKSLILEQEEKWTTMMFMSIMVGPDLKLEEENSENTENDYISL